VNRRHFLGLSAMGSLGLSQQAFASNVPAGGRKIILVYNYGGWDPTRVFAAEFDNRAVDMERSAEVAQVGSLHFVDHAERPSVREFFTRFGGESVFLNGVLVPSVAHENCLKLSLTGTSADGAADWPALIAGDRIQAHALPHIVVGGPSFPGDHGAAVTRAGASGQLEGLLSGDILDWSETSVRAPSSREEDVMDDYLARRAGAAVMGAGSDREAELLAGYESSLERSRTLKGLLNVIEWNGGSDLTAQAGTAISALSMGLSRCATLNFSYHSWDTHALNDLYQSRNFERLFNGLVDLMDTLHATPGTEGGSLAEETVVVVMSEMGRTPRLNEGEGKDHWPYTSVMMVGPGLTGGRVVGGFDDYYYGRMVDMASGEVSDAGVELGCENVGATLLKLCGVDPEEAHPGVAALDGILT